MSEEQDGEIVSHLFDFYAWVKKNHPEIYEEFLRLEVKT